MIGLSVAAAHTHVIGINLLVNSRFAGAVTGTPGTAPDGWGAHQTGGSLEALGEALRVTAQGRQVYAQTVAVQPGPHVWSVRTAGGGIAVQEAVNVFALPAGSSLVWRVNGTTVPGISPLPAEALVEVVLSIHVAGTVSVRFGVGLISPQDAAVTFREPMFEPGAATSGYRPT